ncbi:MAG TPA: hypothetical protein VJ608_10550 [Albitalea sp.]|nr:hypothetical protein [Albitalea sp.]
MTWGPAISLRHAVQLYKLDRRDILLLALSGAARVEGGRIRLASGNRVGVEALLESARAEDSLRSLEAANDAALAVGDMLALLDLELPGSRAAY